MPTVIYIHPIAQAQFDGTAVGTILRDPNDGTKLINAISRGLETTTPEPWGGIIVQLPKATFNLLCAGAIPIPADAADSDFTIREHRDQRSMFYDRTRAPADTLKPRSASAIVYTAEAFCADPEVTPEQLAAFKSNDCTHALVTLAATGVTPADPELSFTRFVKNLAGGSNRFTDMPKDELVALAKKVTAYNDTFITVG